MSNGDRENIQRPESPPPKPKPSEPRMIKEGADKSEGKSEE